MQTTVLNNIVDKVERLYGLQNSYKEMPLLQKAKKLMKKASPPKSKTPRSTSKNKNQLDISRRSNRNLSISENNSRTTSCSNLDKKPKKKPTKTPDEQSFRLLIMKKPKEKVLIKEKENTPKIKRSIDLSEKDFQKTHSSIKSKDFNSSTLNRFHEYDAKKKENLAKLKAEKVDRELKEVKTQTILQTPPPGKRIYERTPEILKKREKEIENLKSLLFLQKQKKDQIDQKQAPSRTPSPSRPYSAFFSDMLHWKQKTQNQSKIRGLAQKDLEAKELTFKPQLISNGGGRKEEERRREEKGRRKEDGENRKGEEGRKKKEGGGEKGEGEEGGRRRVEERLEEWGKGAEKRRKELEDQLRPEFKPKICEKSLQMAKTGRISSKMKEIQDKSAERKKTEKSSKSPNFKLASSNFKSSEKVKRDEEGRRKEEEKKKKEDNGKSREEGKRREDEEKGKREENEGRRKEEEKRREEEGRIRDEERRKREEESQRKEEYEKRLIRKQESEIREEEGGSTREKEKNKRRNENESMEEDSKRREEEERREEEDGGRGKEMLEKIKEIIRDKEDASEKRVCFKEEAEMFIPIQDEERGEEEEEIL